MRVCGKEGYCLTSGRNLRAGGGFTVSTPSVSGHKRVPFVIASLLREQSDIDAAAREYVIAAFPVALRCRARRQGELSSSRRCSILPFGWLRGGHSICTVSIWQLVFGQKGRGERGCAVGITARDAAPVALSVVGQANRLRIIPVR